MQTVIPASQPWRIATPYACQHVLAWHIDTDDDTATVRPIGTHGYLDLGDVPRIPHPENMDCNNYSHAYKPQCPYYVRSNEKAGRST